MPRSLRPSWRWMTISGDISRAISMAYARRSALSHGVGGVEDQFKYLGRPGGERCVAGVELDGFAGADTLSHPPLGLRRDHTGLGRDLVPALRGLPRRLP